MRVDGYWLLCDDGVTRPVIRGTVEAADGRRIRALFLADTAADRTAFSADILHELGLSPVASELGLEGVGGRANSVVVKTCIRLERDAGKPISITGSFAAFTDPEVLDLCLLGRDVTNLFALILDRPQDLICLLGPGHRDTITTE